MPAATQIPRLDQLPLNASENLLHGAPPASATKSLLRGGSALVSGNAQGTWLGINTASGNLSDLIDLQNNGDKRFTVDYLGRTMIGQAASDLLVTGPLAYGAWLGVEGETSVASGSSTNMINCRYHVKGFGDVGGYSFFTTLETTTALPSSDPLSWTDDIAGLNAILQHSGTANTYFGIALQAQVNLMPGSGIMDGPVPLVTDLIIEGGQPISLATGMANGFDIRRNVTQLNVYNNRVYGQGASSNVGTLWVFNQQDWVLPVCGEFAIIRCDSGIGSAGGGACVRWFLKNESSALKSLHKGNFIQGVGGAVPDTALIPNGCMEAWLDELDGLLTFYCKTSLGAVKTGSIPVA